MNYRDSFTPDVVARRIVDGVLIKAATTPPDTPKRQAAIRAAEARGLRQPHTDHLHFHSSDGTTTTVIESYWHTPRPLVPDYVDEQDRCWATGPHGGPCPHRAETDVGLCKDCRDEIRARVDDG